MQNYLRYLRIAFSITCLITCVLLIALWVRSYWWQDTVFWRYYTPNGIHIYTSPGRFWLDTFTDRPHVFMETYSNGSVYEHWRPSLDVSSMQLTEPTAWHLYASPIGNPPLIPLWFPLVLMAVFAALPWIRWSNRFSLRTLLIATTLVAIILGAIIYAVK